MGFGAGCVGSYVSVPESLKQADLGLMESPAGI